MAVLFVKGVSIALSQGSDREFEESSTTTMDDPHGLIVRGKIPASGSSLALSVTLMLTLHGENFVAVYGSVVDTLVERHQPVIEQVIASLKLFEPLVAGTDDHGDTPGTATVITLGDSISGKLETTEDIDYFEFMARAGTTYEAVAELSGIEDASMFLYSRDGTCVLTGSMDYNNTGIPIIRWPITKDGMYHLSVQNADETAPGAYNIRLAITTDGPTDDHGSDFCVSTTINLGDELDGIIHEPFEPDWFRFQAEAGKTYTITVRLGTLDDPLLGIWDTDGQTILDLNDDFDETQGSRLKWTAPVSSTYFLDVESADALSTGSYTLILTAEQ